MRLRKPGSIQPRDEDRLGLPLGPLRVGDSGEFPPGVGALLRVAGAGRQVAEPRHLSPARVERVLEHAEAGGPAVQLKPVRHDLEHPTAELRRTARRRRAPASAPRPAAPPRILPRSCAMGGRAGRREFRPAAAILPALRGVPGGGRRGHRAGTPSMLRRPALAGLPAASPAADESRVGPADVSIVPRPGSAIADTRRQRPARSLGRRRCPLDRPGSLMCLVAGSYVATLPRPAHGPRRRPPETATGQAPVR